MGARGPAPTPTKILKARGSWLAKVRKGEPEPPIAAPDAPKFLDAEARAEWNRQVPLLLEMGVLTKSDRAGLAVWCSAWSDFAASFTKRGLTEKHRFVMRREASDKLLKVAAQFGFTPAARTRLRAEKPAEPDDPMERLLKDHHN